MIASGGMMTITLPSGRSSTPSARAASQTRWPRFSVPRIRLLRRRVAHQFDAGDQAALADVADVRQAGDPREMLGEAGDFRLQVEQRLLFLEDVERGQGGRRPQRIAAVSVAVEERLALGISAQKRPPNLVGRQRGGHRQVAAGEPLGQAEQIGRDVLVLAGEHACPVRPKPTATSSAISSTS